MHQLKSPKTLEPMTNTESRLLKKANNAFLAKNYKYALEIYNESLKKYKNTVLESIIKNNIERTKILIQSSERNKPKVCVVVPVYNAIDDVKKCLKSLLESYDVDPIQIIIVNDGSNEETSKFLDNFSKKNKKIILINN